MELTRENVRRLGVHYEKRAEQFRAFSTSVHTMIDEAEIPSLTISEDSSPNEFRVHFLGQMHAIRYEYIVADGHSTGYLVPYCVDEMNDDTYTPQAPLEINGTGNVRLPETTDWLESVASGSETILYRLLLGSALKTDAQEEQTEKSREVSRP